MDMPSAIRAVTERRDLAADDMRAVMQAIMTGHATPAQIGGFLVGLRMKGETVEEIAAAAEVMRALATPVVIAEREHLVDTCGTGGDASHTFNISTTAAFVVAAAGGKVAKHGNRSVSSKSGSADVLEAAGVNLDLDAAQVAQCVEQVGVGFMFAPKHHGAMKHAIGPRREMGVRTVFNLLGPLTNPAGAPNQVLGVFHAQWLEPLAQVLGKLGSRHVLVVNAEDGLDEISIGAETQVPSSRMGWCTAIPSGRSSSRWSAPASARWPWPARPRAWRSCMRCSTTSTARRATSCCSTPAPPSTPPAWRRRWSRASTGRAPP